MNNIHTKLFGGILVLVAASIWVMFARPTKLGLDIQGGMRVALQAETDKLRGKAWDPTTDLQTVTNVIQRRVDALGVAEPVVYPKPPDQIVIELPGIKDPEQARQTISSTARLEFRYVPELDEGGDWSVKDEKRKGRNDIEEDTGFQIIVNREGDPVSKEELDIRVFEKEPLLTGEDLKANSMPDVSQGRAIIHFEFKDDAKDTFEDFTRGHIGKTLAIFLDQRLISAPQIHSVIPGQGIIEGNFTAEAAKLTSDLLNAGALPVPLKEVQFDEVQATLGRQAVNQTLWAGILGLSLILVFMLAYYKLPGALADLALILYALFTFAVYKLVPVTLTVPGIAGFILSIGMAVDANILIFERLREERRAGKTMRAAIEAGFNRAFTAIFDSNMCTIITCFILYWWGTGQVRGFAYTLAIGVVISMFTAITVTRTFLLLAASTAWGQNDSLYALGRGFHPRLKVCRRPGLWFTISALIIVPGVIFMSLGGIKRSVEFSSGTETTVRFVQQPTLQTVTAAARAAGHQEARVVIGSNYAYIVTKRLDEPAQTALVAALKSGVGEIARTSTGSDDVSVSSVDPIVSRELTRNAFLQVVVASVLIVLYLAVRFSIPNIVEGFKYGVCAVEALIHDALVVLGSFAIFGYFLNWQIDSLFVTAMLTVIGFSTHDTIVIFDRIRENLRHKERGETFADVAERAVDQTLARSINTSLTVIMVLVAMLALGGPVIRLFVLALLVGVLTGVYSSLFNAVPLLNWWKRLTGAHDTAMGSAAPVRRPAPAPAAAPAAATVATPRRVTQRPTDTAAPDAGAADGGQAATAEAAARTKVKKKGRRQ